MLDSIGEHSQEMSMKILLQEYYFCNWFCDAVCNGEVDPWQTYFTDQIT